MSEHSKRQRRMAGDYSVTYSITTPESAEEGDYAESGVIYEGASLRSALKVLHDTRTSRVDGVESIETDSHPCVQPRWVTVINGREYETGESESRSLHIPSTVTAASARRIARLAGVTL